MMCLIYILAFCDAPTLPIHLTLVKGCVSVGGLNVFMGEGRRCCGGWSSLERHTPVKEVVLHLLKGHFRHINYIILHPV